MINDVNFLYERITKVLDDSFFAKKYKGYNYLRDLLMVRLSDPHQYYKAIQIDLADKYNVNYQTIEKNIRFLIAKNTAYSSYTNLQVVDKISAMITT
jgi:hypothetical protein